MIIYRNNLRWWLDHSLTLVEANHETELIVVFCWILFLDLMVQHN